MRSLSLTPWLLLIFGVACLPGTEVPVDAAPNDGDGGTRFCSINEECPEGWTCLSGVCSDRECEIKDTCPAGKVCTDGWCADPPEHCAGPEDCPGDWMCEGFTRTCIDPSPSGCATSFDCVLEPGCEDGCDCNPSGECVPLNPVDAGFVDASPSDSGGVDSNVTFDAGPPPGLELGGYRIENREQNPVINFVDLPEGTRILPGQTLVIGRDATKTDFERAWSVSLDNDVVYLTSHAASTGVPIINGGERWALLSPSGTLLDGVTITGAKNYSYQRVSAESAEFTSSWSTLDYQDATPGSTSLPASGVGLLISEWSDQPETGMYDYEFIELYYAP